MIIYPGIELKDGACVTLTRGALGNPERHKVAPMDAARAFLDAGAEWLHVVDYDAISGTGDNAALIQEIIKLGPPVQVAGGIRSEAQVEAWCEAGAGRVVMGTAALRDPQMVRTLAKHHPDQIMVAVDSRGGMALADGWREETAFTAEEFASWFAEEPLAGFIFTDVDFEEERQEQGLATAVGFADAQKLPVIVTGVVRSLDDISYLRHLPNIGGIITSRALFAKRFGLEEALAIANAPYRAPEFL